MALINSEIGRQKGIIKVQKRLTKRHLLMKKSIKKAFICLPNDG